PVRTVHPSIGADLPSGVSTGDLSKRADAYGAMTSGSADGEGPALDPRVERGRNMALSDRLTELAKRAKEAEDRSRAAANEAREALRSDVERASASARKQADELAQRSASAEAKASDWWGQVQNDWAKHVATVRDNIDAIA